MKPVRTLFLAATLGIASLLVLATGTARAQCVTDPPTGSSACADHGASDTQAPAGPRIDYDLLTHFRILEASWQLWLTPQTQASDGAWNAAARETRRMGALKRKSATLRGASR